MTNIDPRKWQEHLCRRRVNNIAKRRQGVLTPQMSVHVDQDYNPHTRESHTQIRF